VIDARWVKPLDEELLARHLQAYKHILTLEDHQRAGGFGSAVLESTSRLASAAGDAARARVKVLAIPDRFVEHKTSREEQLAEVGLDPESIERTIRTLLQTSRV
jgi:1-deoxy-D-xylulose-5-phosphate synthase